MCAWPQPGAAVRKVGPPSPTACCSGMGSTWVGREEVGVNTASETVHLQVREGRATHTKDKQARPGENKPPSEGRRKEAELAVRGSSRTPGRGASCLAKAQQLVER